MKHHHWVGAGLLALGLAACAEPPATSAAPSHAPQTAVQLVIRFTGADGVWSAKDIVDLQASLSADISPVAAVSSTAWAYRIAPHSGQGMNKILSSLRARPEVAHVDVDGKARNP